MEKIWIFPLTITILNRILAQQEPNVTHSLYSFQKNQK